MVVFGIDEAHCGVLWGGTFIQEWGYLGSITKALSLSLSQWTCGRPPVLLMTATAPPAERSFLKSAFLLRKLQYIQVYRYPVRVCCDFSISVS